MSYYIIRSYDIENRSITGACNNIRPLDFHTWQLKYKDGSLFSKEDFILALVIDGLDGNYQYRENNKINIILNEIRKDEAYTIFEKMRWGYHRIFDRQFIDENYESIDKLYTSYLKHKINSIASSKKIVKVRSAICSDYNENYDVFVAMDEKVYIGKRKNYNNAGEYDNSDESLIYCGDDHQLFYALSDKKYPIDDKLKSICIEIYAKLSKGASL